MDKHKKITTGYNLEELLGRKPVALHNHAISTQLSGKVVLITGAAGSIGSELVKQVALFSPKGIIMLDQAESPLYFISREMENGYDGIEFYSVLCSITDTNALEQVFDRYRPQVVYHAAAYKHVPMLEENPAQAVFVNISGTKNVADNANKYNAETFVLISTDKAVNPGSVMGASKLIAERFIQALHAQLKQANQPNSTKYIITRFGNVLGSSGSVVPIFERQIKDRKAVTLTHPDMERYFMTIKEACQLVLEAGAMGLGGEIYIFSMGQPVKIIDLAIKMITLAGLKPYEDIDIIITGLRAGEKLNEELVTETTVLLPTKNPSIMVAEGTPPVLGDVLKSIQAMETAAKVSNLNNIVDEMKRFLPDFVSLNSKYKYFNDKFL